MYLIDWSAAYAAYCALSITKTAFYREYLLNYSEDGRIPSRTSFFYHFGKMEQAAQMAAVEASCEDENVEETAAEETMPESGMPTIQDAEVELRIAHLPPAFQTSGKKPEIVRSQGCVSACAVRRMHMWLPDGTCSFRGEQHDS